MDQRFARRRRAPGGLVVLLVASVLPSDASAQAPPAQATSCTAAPRGRFHLRPKAQIKSAGPELAKGTPLAVLAQLPPPEKGDSRPIYQVRVSATGATGYVYLRRRELSPGCPLVWPGQEELKAGEPAQAAKGTCLQPGPAKTAAALFGKACTTGKHPKDDGRQVDVNGDGRPDWVVVAEGDQREFAVLLNTPAGHRTLRLDLADGGEKIWELSDVVSAGPATFIIHQNASWENSTSESGETEQDGNITFTVYRLLADGRAYRVFVLNSDNFNGSCKFQGYPDQSLGMRCDDGSQRLRWDEKARVLRPSLDPL